MPLGGPPVPSESEAVDSFEGADLTELSAIFGLPAEQSWQERALCSQTDPEAFFPEKGGSTREAKRICVGCEVRDECLEYALEHDSGSASGAGCPSGSGGVSSAAPSDAKSHYWHRL